MDELLDLVGLAPDEYRDRYPAELSGGQQQRVGVARALAADPPIMLMDEPFGAVDPITRDRLQDEFLRIQEDIKKTIVFVTHDIDEAIKMGDKIAILKEGGVLAQYDTPENILASPDSEFVSSFVGGDRVLKRLSLTRVGDDGPRPGQRRHRRPPAHRRRVDPQGRPLGAHRLGARPGPSWTRTARTAANLRGHTIDSMGGTSGARSPTAARASA